MTVRLIVPRTCDEAECTRRPTQVLLGDTEGIKAARCDWHVILVPEDVT